MGDLELQVCMSYGKLGFGDSRQVTELKLTFQYPFTHSYNINATFSLCEKTNVSLHLNTNELYNPGPLLKVIFVYVTAGFQGKCTRVLSASLTATTHRDNSH